MIGRDQDNLPQIVKLAQYLLLFSIILMVQSCDPNRIAEQNIQIEGDYWNKDDQKKFEFSINDTSLTYNLYVNLRNRSTYPYSNIYIFVEMISPSELYFMDTLEILLADQSGKWLGSGIGNIWQSRVPLAMGVKMKESGQYTISVKHGMREDDLKAISDVGIRIESL